MLVGIKIPSKHISIPTARNESRIIIEPMKASDWAQMLLIDHILGVFSSVELVNIYMAL